MPHESPLTRQWILLRTLSARRYGATVKALAEEMEVGLKTIRRDLAPLQSAGLPLEETVVGHGLKRWRIDPERWKPSLGFAFDEAVALYVARRLLEPLAGTPFWAAAQSALKKTRPTLSASYDPAFALMASNWPALSPDGRKAIWAIARRAAARTR